jgi:CubicO group peptidase (beta-lactamase class C family)
MLARSIVRCLALIAGVAASPAIHAQLPASFDDFDRLVEEQLSTWRTPGVAIAIVIDGKVASVKGYGWRDLEKRLPMTSRTVQPIGSIAKSMTSITLAKLVREGKLSWDRPVREWLPEFRLADDAIAAQVTVRDLLTHRSSFHGSDWVWYCAPDTREQLIRKVRHLELKGGLRERFQYSDSMYVVAGYMGGRVAGTTWEGLVQRDVLDPLSMRSAGFTMTQYFQAPEHSAPYANDEDGNAERVKPCEADAVGPAGGFLYASAEEMGRYVAMLASGGSYEGKTIVDARDLAELMSPQTVMAGRSPYEELSALHYGMGFTIRHYRGMHIVLHAGTNDGWKARFVVLPARKAGVFLAFNSLQDDLSATLTYAVLDRLAGLPPIDWGARLLEAREKSRAAAAQARARKTQARKDGTRPSRDLDALAGKYVHDGYGILTISTRAPSDPVPLEMEFHGFKTPLAHVHYDVFEGVPTKRPRFTEPLRDASLLFVPGFDGEVRALQIKLYAGADPLEFRRQK